MLPQVDAAHNSSNLVSRINQAKILKVAAVTIAAPRYMGAFAASIGISAIEHYPALQTLEVLSGGAMALLEGFALAFILSKWRLLKPGSTHWYTLLVNVLILAISLPLVALPYLLIEQNGLHVAQLFEGRFLLQAVWSFLVAAVPVFVVMGVGFADVDQYERQTAQAKQQAKVKQARRALRQGQEQKPSKDFTCEYCGAIFDKQKALNGHKANCKARANEPALAISTNGRAVQ
jgi:hypothetical protein